MIERGLCVNIEMPLKLPAAEAITLRDGTALTIRPIWPEDAPRLQALHARLSPETIYLRFMGMPPVLFLHEAEQLAQVNYQTRMAFVATREQGNQEIIYVRWHNASAVASKLPSASARALC